MLSGGRHSLTYGSTSPALHPRTLTEAGGNPQAQAPSPCLALLLRAPVPSFPSGKQHRGANLPTDADSGTSCSLLPNLATCHLPPAPPRQPTPPCKLCFPQGEHVPWTAGSRAADSPSSLGGRETRPRTLTWARGQGRATPKAQGRTLLPPRFCQPFANLRVEPCALGPLSQLLHRQAEGPGQRRVGQGGGPGPGSCPQPLLLTVTAEQP